MIKFLKNGKDTSDATATAEDILNPKTAYVNDEKITGAITSSSVKLTEAEAINVGGSSSVWAVDLYRNLAIYGSGRTVNICRIENNIINTSNMKIINTEDFGVSTSFNIYNTKFSIDDDYNSVGVWVSYNQSNASSAFCYFVLDVKTLEIIEQPIYKTINLELNTNRESNYVEALNIFPRPTYRNQIGLMRRKTGDNTYGIVVIEAKNFDMSIIYTSSQNGKLGDGSTWGGRGFTAAWDSTGRYIWGRGKGNNALTNTSFCCIFDCTQNKLISTDANIVLINDNYACNRSNIYKLPNMQVINTHSISIFGTTNNSAWSGFAGEYFLYSYGTTANLYKFDSANIKLELIKSFSMSDIAKALAVPNKHLTYYTSTIEGYMYNKDELIVGLNYKGHNFYYPYDTNGEASDVLNGKVIYNKNGRIVGTMPNNGELNYTPGTEQQTIPTGYTSGGIIAGEPNLIPENIKTGVSIFGVEGTLEPVIETVEVIEERTTLDITNSNMTIEGTTLIIGGAE